MGGSEEVSRAEQCRAMQAGQSRWSPAKLVGPEEEAIGPLDKGGLALFPWKGDALRRCESATTTAAKNKVK